MKITRFSIKEVKGKISNVTEGEENQTCFRECSLTWEVCWKFEPWFNSKKKTEKIQSNHSQIFCSLF